jgi:ATP-dependent metalloprotease FtsH
MERERLLAVLVGFAGALLVFLAVVGVNILPLLLLAGLVGALVATRTLYRGGFRTRLGSSANLAAGSIPPIGFDDVGGQESAKRELLEALEFLRVPDRIRELGIRPLKGVLFSGPPGTGKTLLAKAAANYTRSSFIAASGSEFVEMYAGVGAQRVRQLFADARGLARREGNGTAIIFIDEIEVMAGHRGRHESHLEYDQTLNQLLVELDGISESDEVRVLLMAASNRADLLDHALIRPGRFDRVVRVDLPDRTAREHILRIHSQNKPLDADVDLAAIAGETWGFSGAHLESVANEAAILALRRHSRSISRADFEEAVDKVMLGERMDRTVTDAERRRVAVHEGGHALVSELTRPGSVATVTVVPRGLALGHVRHGQEEDPVLKTRDDLMGEIAVCLAGAAAEELILGEPSTGAASDFDQAFDLGRRLVLAGLSELGPVDPDLIGQGQLWDVVRALLSGAREEVDRLLTDRAELLGTLADRLLEQETLDGADLRTWLAA